MCGPWTDRVLEIRHDTGFRVEWGTKTIVAGGMFPQRKHWVSIVLPDQDKPLVFDGQTLDQACWALCVSEFPDPLDRPELMEAS